jgi:transposase-like protein
LEQQIEELLTKGLGDASEHMRELGRLGARLVLQRPIRQAPSRSRSTSSSSTSSIQTSISLRIHPQATIFTSAPSKRNSLQACSRTVDSEAPRKHRDPVGPDWRLDETYARIRARWHYIYRASDEYGQAVDAYVSPTRDMVAARTFFEWAIASSGTTPHRVITDKAATYPPALAAAAPGVLHRTGRYRTNGVERDHGFLKERLGPMRGLESVASAAIVMRGHALMRNIRLGFYRIAQSVPQRLVFAWTWSRLAEAV